MSEGKLACVFRGETRAKRTEDKSLVDKEEIQKAKEAERERGTETGRSQGSANDLYLCLLFLPRLWHLNPPLSVC